MYVSVPKNYSGIAFSRDGRTPQEMPRQEMPMTIPVPMPPSPPQSMHEPPRSREECHECREPPAREEKESPCTCDDCQKQDKNPLTCLLTALRNRGKAGFDTEDFLLISLIVLLLGKEGNEDIVLTLAMLLLV